MSCHRKLTAPGSAKPRAVDSVLQPLTIGKLNEADSVVKLSTWGPNFESKFDELKIEIVHKIEKELVDAQNARDFISQKYDELCSKIQFLTELDATVTGFRTDVKAIEKQITDLSTRVDDIEKRAISQEVPSLTSSMF